MSNLLLKPVLVLMLVSLCAPASSRSGKRLRFPTETDPDVPPIIIETKAERDRRMKWWREARFGMFIHWGLYAVPAGEYKGQRSTRIGEWIIQLPSQAPDPIASVVRPPLVNVTAEERDELRAILDSWQAFLD